MRSNVANMEIGAQQQEERIKESLRSELECQNKNLKGVIEQTNSQTLHTVDIKIKEQNSQFCAKLNQMKIEQTSQIQTVVDQEVSLQNRHIQEEITVAKGQINDHECTISDLRQQISNLNNHRPSSLIEPTNITVVCTGNSNIEPEMPLPKFDGRGHSPREYLNRLQKYYRKSLAKGGNKRTNELEYLIDLIEASLERHAAKWFDIIKADISDWTSFEHAFMNKYWSRDTQRGIRHRLENEKYRPQGNLTRSEYFIERVLTLQSLTPPLEEEEIITLLSEHFDPLIQDARRVQNITTLKDFEALLLREDIKDGNANTKQKTANHQMTAQRDQHPQNDRRRPDWRGYPPAPHNRPEQQRYDRREYNNPPYRGPAYNNGRNQGTHDRRTSPPRPTQQRNYPTNEQNRVCNAIVTSRHGSPTRKTSPQRHLNQ